MQHINAEWFAVYFVKLYCSLCLIPDSYSKRFGSQKHQRIAVQWLIVFGNKRCASRLPQIIYVPRTSSTVFRSLGVFCGAQCQTCVVEVWYTTCSWTHSTARSNAKYVYKRSFSLKQMWRPKTPHKPRSIHYGRNDLNGVCLCCVFAYRHHAFTAFCLTSLIASLLQFAFSLCCCCCCNDAVSHHI